MSGQGARCKAAQACRARAARDSGPLLAKGLILLVEAQCRCFLFHTTHADDDVSEGDRLGRRYYGRGEVRPACRRCFRPTLLPSACGPQHVW